LQLPSASTSLPLLRIRRAAKFWLKIYFCVVGFDEQVSLVHTAIHNFVRLWNGVPHVLVVSRKIGERILIGDKIAVTVVKIGNGGVRIGIEAPPEMAIAREELAEQLRKAEQLTVEKAQQQAAADS